MLIFFASLQNMSQRKASFFRGLLLVAGVVLLHAAYSVAEWRSATRSSDGLALPLDITLQTFFGLFLAMVSVLNLAGEFREIRASVELSAKSWETAGNRPSFYVYNHRGRALHPEYDPSIAYPNRRSLMEIPDKFLS